ncbi:hypothetical protein [Thiocapsa roseopersicina]|uniref:Uncharacterized protein n=1 Tax=Thiocapsa roseopersicina TaxID=1058 RepID=A0A1H2W773_THIRO|nr:hypothetical protein [Thiocapsa roseopersicina]SDW76502.1 hypothetical protein SAMN05421783_10877 [Thiocapsa roseopersicina]
MKIKRISARGMDPGLIGLAVLSMCVVTGCADAETHTSGGSTAVIQQSGGSRPVETQVTRDRDGQTIVTRDGRSTDITIQRDSAASASGSDGPRATPQSERFERPLRRDGFSSRFPGTSGGADDVGETSGSTRDAFKARMLERMR